MAYSNDRYPLFNQSRIQHRLSATERKANIALSVFRLVRTDVVSGYRARKYRGKKEKSQSRYELSLKSRDKAWLFAIFENPASTMINIDDCSFKVLDYSISFLTQKNVSLFRRLEWRIRETVFMPKNMKNLPIQKNTGFSWGSYWLARVKLVGWYKDRQASDKTSLNGCQEKTHKRILFVFHHF